MHFIVNLSRLSKRQLKRVPSHIVAKLQYWVALVEKEGLLVARRVKGFNDEALAGTRVGQRSIRLNSAYRAIYREQKDGLIHVVQILEVNKHEY
ncbi:MAG: hypothetical protein RL189_1169 [Pseudomonadota bacterium]